MGSTQVVTAYYPYREGPPVWGKAGRERWYKYSLASISHIGVPITCYTDPGQAHDELAAYLDERKIQNITLKEFDITTGPFHDRIHATRIRHGELYNNELHPFYRMPFSVYWMKWKFLEWEHTPDQYTYWIDGGLSTEGVLPHTLNDFAVDMHTRMDEWKHYSFTKAFCPALIQKMNHIAGNRTLNLCRMGGTDNDFNRMQNMLHVPVMDSIYHDNLFPVGALFGGKDTLSTYIQKIHECMEMILATDEYLCTEQEIMGYVHTFNRPLFHDWTFHDFYHDDWEIFVDGTKQRYRTIAPTNISFSQFFMP
jgi:hypothetical protein